MIELLKVRLKLLARKARFDLVTYRPFLELLKEWNVNTVLDVGANVGQFGKELRELGYKGHIVSFEPTSTAFRTLAARIMKDPLWEAYHLGLGSKSEEGSLFVGPDSRLSSFLEPAQVSDQVAKENVNVKRLDAWLEEHPIDLAETCLKLDVQGYEPDILVGAGAALPKLKAIITELGFTTSYKGQWHADEMMAFLRHKGFQMWATRRGLWTPYGNREMECDGLFRNERIS